MNIGIIGAGAIATFLLEEINHKEQGNLQITSVFVRNRKKYEELETKYGVTLYTELDAFLDSDIEIVAEAANIQAVQDLMPTIIQKMDVVLISIGALANESFWKEMVLLSDQYNHKLHLPSGAIGGLDLLQNAHALGNLSSVSLTTRKPAQSLVEEALTEERVLFTGKAADAIQQYPKNLNVSIILSLAGIGLEKTKVSLVADPHLQHNVHQVDVTGDFGEASFTITNHPLPQNPKTSYLAALSVLGTLKRIGGSTSIG